MNFAMMALAALVAGGAGQSLQQFDLVCEGSGSAGIATRHYRVDLAAKRWCWEDCKDAVAIQRVTPDRITFAERDEPRSAISHFVSRHDGALTHLVMASYGNVWFNATCEPAPFSGLPEPKF